MGTSDYTAAERQRRFRAKRKAMGLSARGRSVTGGRQTTATLWPIPDYVKADYRNLPYKIYLNTNHWKLKRQQKKAALGGVLYCELNRKHTGTFDIHHNTYVNLGDERMEDLICLCRTCHEKHHDRRQQ